MTVLIYLIISVVALTVSECRKNELDKKVHGLKSSHDVSLHMGSHHNHKVGRLRLRGKHLQVSEEGLNSLQDDWMKLPKESDCKTLKCGHKEFCYANPETGDEKCISRATFMEGRRLFKSFHKVKETLKEDMKPDIINKELDNAEHMKDVYELLHDYKKHSHSQKDVKSKLEKTHGSLFEEVTAGSVQECRPTELYQLKKRMVGWFVLLHTESRREHHLSRSHKKYNQSTMGNMHKKGHKDMNMHHKKQAHTRKRRSASTTAAIETETHHHCQCPKSVMWEFHKQDTNKNQLLSHEELANMEHMWREPCMKPLIKSCDTDGDSAITHGEWCCCFTNTVPPCVEKKHFANPKEWVPLCDNEGFYERQQCHATSGHCWCVDLNGNTIPDTKKLGSAHCGLYGPDGRKQEKNI